MGRHKSLACFCEPTRQAEVIVFLFNQRRAPTSSAADNRAALFFHCIRQAPHLQLTSTSSLRRTNVSLTNHRGTCSLIKATSSYAGIVQAGRSRCASKPSPASWDSFAPSATSTGPASSS